MNYYEALNVNQNASLDAINQSFRTLAKKYHPDLNSEYDAKEKFLFIYEAYSFLKDNEKRNIYNELINKKQDNTNDFNYNENKYNEWKKEASKEGKYYSENKYDIFYKNVLEKLIIVGKKAGEIGLVIIFGSLMIIIKLILKVVMYILPASILGFILISLSMGFRQGLIPVALIALALNIILTIFLRKKLRNIILH